MGWKRWAVLVGFVALLATACSSASDTASTTQASPPGSGVTGQQSTTTTPLTVTSSSSTSTTSVPQPRVQPEVVALEALPYVGSPPAWVRGGVELGRDRSHLLGRAGDVFLVVSSRWDGRGPHLVRTSVDGVVWSEPVEMAGIPADGELGGLAGGATGAMALVVSPSTKCGAIPATAYTSVDGLLWVEEDSASFAGQPDAIAGSEVGFAVVSRELTYDGCSLQSEDDSLVIRVGDGPWETVDLQWDHIGDLTGVGDAYLVGGGDPGGIVIDSDLTQTRFAVPYEHAADHTDWDGALFAWDHSGFAGYEREREPTLYRWQPGSAIWHLLPAPIATISEDQFWSFNVLTAGAAGAVAVGHTSEDGDAMPPETAWGVVLESDEHQIVVTGDCVNIVDQHYCGEHGIDTATWFDEQGTLTVPHPTTGENLATFSCSDMRQAARRELVADMGTPQPGLRLPDGLIPWPEDQELWHTPNGQAWIRQPAQDIVGNDAWIEQGVTIGDRSVLIVTPNGRRPMTDPPGCPLEIYPEERPYEVWVTDVEVED